MTAKKSVVLPQVLVDLAERFPQFQLCYVNNGQAFFTTSLKDQWGDDWNDVPLDCNAGEPYGPTVFHYSDGTSRLDPRDWHEDGTPRYQLMRIVFESGSSNVDLAIGPSTSNYRYLSVQDMLAKKAPWLIAKHWEANHKSYGEPATLYAGARLREFFEFIYAAQARVLLPAGESAQPYPEAVPNPVFAKATA